MVSSIVSSISSYFYPPVIKDDEKNTTSIKKDDEKITAPIRKDDEKNTAFVEEDSDEVTLQTKARYPGSGDRYNLCDMDGNLPANFVETVRKVATGIACFIPKTYLTPGDEDGSFKLLDSVLTLREIFFYGKKKIPLVEDHPFSEEPIPGNTTWFPVGENTVMSAGHAVTEKDPTQDPDKVEKGLEIQRYILSRDKIENYLLVFNFEKRKPAAPGTDGIVRYFDEDNVYELERVEAFHHKHLHTNDYVFAHTKRKFAKHIHIFKFAVEKPITGDMVGIVGHPDGSPKKAALGVVKAEKDQYSFSTNIAAYGGNSGSPMLNKKGEVCGILIIGHNDYVEVERNGKKVMIENVITDVTRFPYETCRYITPEMFNAVENLYNKAMEERNQLLEKHERESNKVVDKHKEKRLMNLNKIIYEAIESGDIEETQYQSLEILPKKHDPLIDNLNNPEIQKINSYSKIKFSPFHILELLEYEKELGTKFSKEKRIKILQYMTSYSPITQKLYTVKGALEEMKGNE